MWHNNRSGGPFYTRFQIHFLTGPGWLAGHHYLRATGLNGVHIRVLAVGQLAVPHNRIGQGHLHRRVRFHADRSLGGTLLRYRQSVAKIAGTGEWHNLSLVGKPCLLSQHWLIVLLPTLDKIADCDYSSADLVSGHNAGHASIARVRCGADSFE